MKRRTFVGELAALSSGIAAAPLFGGRSVMDDEAAWREVKAQFGIGRGLIPMNAANMCPPPRSVVAAMERANRSVDADVSFHNRAQYNALRETVRGALARFLDGAPEEFAIVRNASEGNNIIVGGLTLGPDDEVLVTDHNHASNALAWEIRAQRTGFVVKRVTLPAQPRSGAELADAIAREITSRTRVLAFSDVSNSSGFMLPAEELCRLGRDRKIHVHIDGAQTLGAMRLSLSRLGCGSYTASTQKWLMGPREAGILYVRRDLVPGVWPAVVSRGFSDPGDPDPASAKKLETLGQRNEGVLAGLAAAITFVEGIGIDRIEGRVRALAARVSLGLRNIPGYQAVTPATPGLSLGVIVGRFEGLDHQVLHDRLYQAHRVAGAPTGGLRLCPHIYNTFDDVDAAIDAVTNVRKGL